MEKCNFARVGANWASIILGGIPVVLAVLCAFELGQFHYPFGSHVLDEIWDLICLGIALSGLGLRVVATGYASEHGHTHGTLNTTGIFSLMRHPHLLGTLLIYLGAIFFVHDPTLTLSSFLLLWLYTHRQILVRDQVLTNAFGKSFERWAANTPAVVPLFAHWKAPDRSFDWRRALLAEHRTLLVTALVFAALELVGHYVVEHNLEVEGWWIVLLAFSVVLAAAIHALRRWSRLLHDDDRGPLESPGA